MTSGCRFANIYSNLWYFTSIPQSMTEKKSTLKSLARQPSVLIRRWFSPTIVLAIVIPNLTFLGVHYAARSLPVQPITDRVALALNRGDILTDTKTFVYLDSTRGDEPWGDANTLRMAIYRGPSKWKDALAPRLLKPADGIERHPAAELSGAVFRTIAFDPQSGYYHRYWHGNVAIASFLLTVFDVRQARLVLMNSSYFLFMMIPLLAYAHARRLGIILGVICGFGIWFASLPYHGQTFAYAPAFIWSQFVVLPVLWFQRAAGPDRSVIPLGLILGAIAAFVEPMSGAFVLTGCLLFLSLYFSVPDSDRGRVAFEKSARGLAAFLAGLFCSLLFKQITVAPFFGWGQTFGAFIAELIWRIGLTGEKVTYFRLVETVGANLIYLTFGSFLLMKVLVFTSGGAFLIGSTLTAIDIARNKQNEYLFDYIAVLVSITLVAGWYFILPSHNVIHAWITVRLLYLPCALSWVLLWLSAQALLTRRRESQRGRRDLVATQRA